MLEHGALFSFPREIFLNLWCSKSTQAFREVPFCAFYGGGRANEGSANLQLRTSHPLTCRSCKSLSSPRTNTFLHCAGLNPRSVVLEGFGEIPSAVPLLIHRKSLSTQSRRHLRTCCQTNWNFRNVTNVLKLTSPTHVCMTMEGMPAQLPY